MNKWAYIVAFFSVILMSCNRNENQFIVLETDSPDSVYFEFINTGNSTAVFGFSLNQMSLLSENAINRTIDSVCADSLNDAEKVWMFISEYTLHQGLLTEESWLYHPVLLVNSGGSLCGFRSAAMTNLLKHRGVHARSWCLQGHVISEAFIQNNWHVYDPDLGVVYFNEHGNICNYSELSQNPGYISHPHKITSLLGVCDSIQATSKQLAQKYGSTADNMAFETAYPEQLQDKQWVFTLPPGATFSFPVTDTIPGSRVSLAVLKIPPGWTGQLQIPLIPYDHSSESSIWIGGQSIGPTHADSKQFLKSVDYFDGTLEVKSNSEGMIIRFYINPIIYMPQKTNQIQMVGKHVSNVQVILRTRDKFIKPPVQTQFNEAYTYWDSLLSNCHSFDSTQVLSFSDYIVKLRKMQSCPCFSSLKIDTATINQQIISLAAEYKSEMNFDYNQFNSREGFIYSWVQLLQTEYYDSQK